MIYVTKPFLPARKEYNKYLDGIWDRNILTNNGPLVGSLEQKLNTYLKTRNIVYTGNGTIAIQLAIKSLSLTGEIITTPFSYVATTSSIVWENCQPVFIDIDPLTFNINPQNIEQAITSHTTAILATHCFGNPCEVDKIEAIAKRFGLEIIYDAAHCFGSRLYNKTVFEYGTISATSFHATKIMHTIEGGAVFSNDDELCEKVRFMRNFGHHGPERFNGIGINAKNSEFHAAMGLCVLNHIDNILASRKKQSLYYFELLKNQPITYQLIHPECQYNYSYFPILFATEAVMLRVKKKLEDNQIIARRYFYPSLSHLDYVLPQPTPISDQIASRILCLPLFHDLKMEEQEQIANLVVEAINS